MTLTLISAVSFAGAMIVFAAIPGPGVLGTVARSMSSGLKPALALILGIIVGDCVYLLFACFGLTFIARNLGQIFVVVKILGGIYLFWLGMKMWRSDHREGGTNGTVGHRTYRENLVGGALISLSNPKVILFYCGFLPAFLDLPAITIADIGVLAGIVVFALGLVLFTYAVLARSARRIVFSRNSGKIFQRSAGGLMMTAGVLVALDEI